MALVAVDKNGCVRAMIGGYAYGASQYNRALALRSFGSAFKYFVYMTALEEGYDLNDQISDKPITLGSWSPKNYGYKSVGSISFTDAFIKSVNTSTIHIARHVGIEPIIRTAEKLGITSEIKKDLSSVLGSSGVSLLEITSAFSVVARDGLKIPIIGIISVKTKDGRVIYRARNHKPERVVSSSVCQKMRTMMREIVARGTGKRAGIPKDCYGKTGTSNDSRDACFIGVSDPLTVGIWMGNDDNTPMNRNVTGGTLPAMAWREFMLIAFGYVPLPKMKDISPENPEKNSRNKGNKVKKRRAKISDAISKLQ